MRLNTVYKCSVIILLFAFSALLLACGGGKHSPWGHRLAPDYGDWTPVQIEYELDQLVADLSNAEAPPGVDPVIYAQLCDELARQLQAFHSSKIVCTPPTGPENEIVDFNYQDSGGGYYTFTWSYFNVGDYDQSGAVGISDVTPIAINFGQSADDPDIEVVDGNGDGTIDISDVTPLAINFGNNVHHYLLRGAENEDVEYEDYEDVTTIDFTEGFEGSRKHFVWPVEIGVYRYFRIFAVDSDGVLGASSPAKSSDPSAQADAYAEGRAVQFYGVGSTCKGGNVAFWWDFESDGTFDTSIIGTPPNPDIDAGEQSPLYTYPAEGMYTATLRVYDSVGNFSTASVTVGAYDAMPADAPPEVNALVLDLTGALPYTVRCLSFAEDPDGGSIAEYTWNFGYGSLPQSGQFVKHTFNVPGTYNVWVTAEDDDGETSTAHLTVKICLPGDIDNMPPSAVVGLDSDIGEDPVVLLSQSADMDGGNVTYKWDLGDNSIPVYSQDVIYSYPADGAYYAEVHLTDNEGLTSRAGATVVSGSPIDAPPSAMAIAYITEGTQNMRVQFIGEGEDPDGTTVSYAWDFDGDGVYGDFGITEQDPIVIYTAVGTYDIGLKVTDGDGDSGYASVRINVQPCAIATGIPLCPSDPRIPVIDDPPPPRIGIPLDVHCFPSRPPDIPHGPDGEVVYVIYDNTAWVRAGDPELVNINHSGPIFGLFWGPLGILQNEGNGYAGGDVVRPDPLADPPPAEANLKPNEAWEAYRVTRSQDGPPRLERLDIKFKVKRADNSAVATQTYTVYCTHAVGQVNAPGDGEEGEGSIDVVMQVDPTGRENMYNFINLDPGDRVNVYLEVDGEIAGQLERGGVTNLWNSVWDTTTVDSGWHTLRGVLYDVRDPQPGEEGDPGPFWETDSINFEVTNVIPQPPVDHVAISCSPSAGVLPGEAVDITVTTLDDEENPTYSSIFEAFVEISPERSGTMSQLPGSTHERIIPLVDNEDGTYTTAFSWEVAGGYVLSVIVEDKRDGDKVSELHASTFLNIVPDVITDLELYSHLSSQFGPVYFWGMDSYGNVNDSPDTADFTVEIDNPALYATSPQFSPDVGTVMMTSVVGDADYGTGWLTVEHVFSGATRTTFVGYPPWNLRMEDANLPPGSGFPADSFFDVYFDVRIPEAYTRGWNAFRIVLRWPDDAPITYDDTGLQVLMPNINVLPPLPYNGGDGYMYLNMSAWDVDPANENFGENTAFSIRFTTANVPGLAESLIALDHGSFVMNDADLDGPGGPDVPEPIEYDVDLFTDFEVFPFSVKPTKTLNMHIYRVEGSATDAEIQDDVQAAEDMFNLNALLCTLGFYIDFVATVDTIPAADWLLIDEDGDGLDRYDANDDGDYADSGDNNDLFNAMAEPYNYYDASPNTENIYYVPGIRGGAMGTTYWPNGQVAVDNAADTDDLTLAHEKVHEMDLRMDGDFDVGDGADMNDAGDGIQRDPTAAGQGAYEPGNVMNYGDTWMLLTAEQAQHLDP